MELWQILSGERACTPGACLRLRNQIPRKKPGGGAPLSGTAPIARPIPLELERQGSREPCLLPRLPRSRGSRQTRKPQAARGFAAAAQRQTWFGRRGRGGERCRPRPQPAVLTIGSCCRPSELVGGPRPAWAGPRLWLQNALSSAGSHGLGAREAHPAAARCCKSVLPGSGSAVEAEAPLQESPIPAVPSALRKAPVLCRPRSSSRCPRARTPRAAAATAAAAAPAAAARARVAAAAAVARGRGEVRVPRRPGPGGGRELGGRCRLGLIAAPLHPQGGRAHRVGRQRSRARPQGIPAPASGLLCAAWPRSLLAALGCLS